MTLASGLFVLSTLRLKRGPPRTRAENTDRRTLATFKEGRYLPRAKQELHVVERLRGQKRYQKVETEKNEKESGRVICFL